MPLKNPQHILASHHHCKRARECPILETVKFGQWIWVGQVLRRKKDNNNQVALPWTREGKRRQGPKFKRMSGRKFATSYKNLVATLKILVAKLSETMHLINK